jgi:hypothetical protein
VLAARGASRSAGPRQQLAPAVEDLLRVQDAKEIIKVPGFIGQSASSVIAAALIYIGKMIGAGMHI